MVYKNHSSLVDYLGQVTYRKTNPYEKEFLAKETSPYILFDDHRY